jgi:hypothetical protein
MRGVNLVRELLMKLFNDGFSLNVMAATASPVD